MLSKQNLKAMVVAAVYGWSCFASASACLKSKIKEGEEKEAVEENGGAYERVISISSGKNKQNSKFHGLKIEIPENVQNIEKEGIALAVKRSKKKHVPISVSQDNFEAMGSPVTQQKGILILKPYASEMNLPETYKDGEYLCKKYAKLNSRFFGTSYSSAGKKDIKGSILLFSEFGKHPELAKIFNRNNSAKEVLNSKNNDGQTPLHLAVKNDRKKTVSLLLKEGADITLCNKEGRTSLQEAAWHGSSKSIDILLKNIAEKMHVDEKKTLGELLADAQETNTLSDFIDYGICDASRNSLTHLVVLGVMNFFPNKEDGGDDDDLDEKNDAEPLILRTRFVSQEEGIKNTDYSAMKKNGPPHIDEKKDTDNESQPIALNSYSVSQEDTVKTVDNFAESLRILHEKHKFDIENSTSSLIEKLDFIQLLIVLPPESLEKTTNTVGAQEKN